MATERLQSHFLVLDRQFFQWLIYNKKLLDFFSDLEENKYDAGIVHR